MAHIFYVWLYMSIGYRWTFVGLFNIYKDNVVRIYVLLSEQYQRPKHYIHIGY